MTCHYKQAAKEKNILDIILWSVLEIYMLVLYSVFCKSSLTDLGTDHYFFIGGGVTFFVKKIVRKL